MHSRGPIVACDMHILGVVPTVPGMMCIAGGNSRGIDGPVYPSRNIGGNVYSRREYRSQAAGRLYSLYSQSRSWSRPCAA